MEHEKPQRRREDRAVLPGWAKPLLLSLIVFLAGWYSKMVASDTSHELRLTQLQAQVEAVEKEKVSKDQFTEFSGSVVRELRQIHEELVAQREERERHR